MLDTFKVRLKAKALAAGVNLSKTRIDAIADRLHKKFPELTEEADHDDKLQDYYDDDVLKDIAKQDDKVRTLEAKKPKDEPQTPATTDNPQQQQQPADDMPKWAKDLLGEIQTLKAEKQQQTLQQKLNAHEKLKGIPEKFWNKRSLPKTEDEINAFAEDVAADYAEIIPAASTASNTGFMPGRPAGGIKTKEASKEQVKQVVDKII